MSTVDAIASTRLSDNATAAARVRLASRARNTVTARVVHVTEVNTDAAKTTTESTAAIIDGAENRFLFMSSNANNTSNLVSCPTIHFSVFALFELCLLQRRCVCVIFLTGRGCRPHLVEPSSWSTLAQIPPSSHNRKRSRTRPMFVFHVLLLATSNSRSCDFSARWILFLWTFRFLFAAHESQVSSYSMVLRAWLLNCCSVFCRPLIMPKYVHRMHSAIFLHRCTCS